MSLDGLREDVIVSEKDYYEPIATYFVEQKDCTYPRKDYPISGLTLVTADILGETDDTRYVCELKPYPYPVGSSGYGSIGQALALRHYADRVYVGCVASDFDDAGDLSWSHVSNKSSIRQLIDILNVKIPEDYESYCTVLLAVYDHFFSDLGLGLLVVHEKGERIFEVDELVPSSDFTAI